MPKVYLIAGLSENPVAISNLFQSWNLIKTAAAGSVIYHGRPDMDQWRTVRVKTYNALRTACERENWQNVPLFWSDQGAYKVIRLTRLEINAALSK